MIFLIFKQINPNINNKIIQQNIKTLNSSPNKFLSFQIERLIPIFYCLKDKKTLLCACIYIYMNMTIILLFIFF